MPQQYGHGAILWDALDEQCSAVGLVHVNAQSDLGAHVDDDRDPWLVTGIQCLLVCIKVELDFERKKKGRKAREGKERVVTGGKVLLACLPACLLSFFLCLLVCLIVSIYIRVRLFEGGRQGAPLIHTP